MGDYVAVRCPLDDWAGGGGVHVSGSVHRDADQQSRRRFRIGHVVANEDATVIELDHAKVRRVADKDVSVGAGRDLLQPGVVVVHKELAIALSGGPELREQPPIGIEFLDGRYVGGPRVG
jgi:hypothetical protein